MDIQKEVLALIAEQMNIKADSIQPTNNIIDDLKADSLDVVEIVMTLEEKFDLSIPDEEAEKMKTIQDLIDYVKSKKKS